MRGDPRSIEVLRPRSAAEAVSLYGRRPDAVPLAGGTDFMVAFNAGAVRPGAVLDLSRVGEWRSLDARGGSVRIGALVTHAELRDHPLVRREFPLLARACGVVGGVQIQNRGTLGGNIANASPAGDTFPPLSVYGAVVHAVGPSGRRTLPLCEVFAGVKRTALRRAELIEAVELPRLPSPPRRAVFRKVGTRAAQAVSKTVAAGLLWLERGRVKELRFALGSMAPTVRRLDKAEAFLAGRALDRAAVERAVRLLREDVSPIDDIRSTAEYRIRVSENILRSFLE